MQVKGIGAVIMAADPTASAEWLAEHFGFKINVDIGWYVNTQHPDHPSLHLDLMRLGHESMPDPLRDRLGGFIAFQVDDVDAEEERLRGAGVEISLPATTEPWGQRRLQALGPGGLVVEVLQVVAPDPEWLAEQGLAAQ